MTKRLKVIAFAVSLAAASMMPVGTPFVASARAANDSHLTSTAAEAEKSQQQVRSDTQSAGAELGRMIDELDRNGIGGDELVALKAIQKVMGQLSDKDMDKVIVLLQAARSAADPNSARQNIAEASVAQKAITTQMNELLMKYRQQQELYDISLQFAQLADRQNLNLKSVVGLVKTITRRNNGRASENLDDAQKDSLIVQGGEEKSIKDLTGLLLQKLQTIASTADADTADRLRKSLKNAEDGKLSESLKDATDQLGGGHIFSASGDERVARDRLYDLASMVAPDQNSAEKLRHAIETIDAAIAEQKQLITETAAVTVKNPREAVDIYAGIEDREGDLVDGVDRCRKSIDNVAPNAAETLKAAQDRMQESRASLNALQRDPAGEKEKLALAKLEETKKLLETQLAKADEKPTGDLEAQAKQLKEKLTALRIEQEKLNADTAATVSVPRKGPELAKTEQRLTQTARDLQSEASAQSTDVSHEIGLAGNDMSTAAADLDRTLVPDSVAPQTSAVAHLVKAEAMLDDVIKKDEEIKKDLAKAEEARDKVAKLMEDQQKVNQKTDNAAAKAEAVAIKPDDAKPDAAKPDAAKPDAAKPDAAKPDAAKPDAAKPDAAKPDAAKPDAAKPDAAKPDAAKPDAAKPDAAKPDAAKPDAAKPDAAKPDAAKPDAAKPQEASKPPTSQPSVADVAKEQGQVAKNTEDAKATVAEASKEAAAPLDAAKKDMQAAEASLQKPDAPNAQAPQKQAMAELSKAKDALDNQIKQDQTALGQQPDQQQALADAAKAIEQAQQQVQQAQNQMAPNTPMQDLQKAQEQLAQAVQKAAQADPQSQPLQQAQQQAEQAAQQLAQNQPAQAAQQMQQAQQNLEQAAQQPHPAEAGQPHPPEAGQPHPPEAGEPHAPEAGQPHAPEAGEPHAPEAGAPHAPEAGAPHAPEAGAPHAPEAGAPHAPEAGAPGAPEPGALAHQEAELAKAAAALAAQAAQAQALQQAEAALANASTDVNKAQANDQGALPADAQHAMQQASQAAAEAAAQAAAGNQPQANAQAQAAQAALSQAQAAIAMAQSGMEPGQPHPGEPGHEPGNEPGQPGEEQSDQPEQANENAQHQGDSHRKDANANASTNGARGNSAGNQTTYLGLPARDREAIKQTEKEKYPSEYGPAIEQYLKNLSDQENR